MKQVIKANLSILIATIGAKKMDIDNDIVLTV